jgi:hypothetical protein
MASVSVKPNLKILDQPGFVAYDYDPKTFEVTDEMLQVFDWDGGIVIRNLFSKEEVAHILRGLTETDSLTSRAWDLPDGEGRSSRLVIWSHPGHDVTGMVAKCEKVAGTAQKLLRGEVYHYHTKLMMKEARTGGKHLWHQDYGYWYKNGNLRPDMLTAYIAIDPCVKANGCVQFVKGTNRCGRIDHDLVAGQTVANQERLDHILKADGFSHCYGELQPGDCLFFHSNVLHTSDKNDSDMRRWAFLCCYNRADNDPVMKHHHPNYTPLAMVPNEAVLQCTNFTDMSGKEIMNPAGDKTVKAADKY